MLDSGNRDSAVDFIRQTIENLESDGRADLVTEFREWLRNEKHLAA